MSKVISASDAAALIKDGATVGVAACVVSGWPEEIAIAIDKRFLACGHPVGMSLVHASGIGNWKDKGTKHFAHAGMIVKWIGGHCGLSPDFAKMVLSGACEGYNLPRGSLRSCGEKSRLIALELSRKPVSGLTSIRVWKAER